MEFITTSQGERRRVHREYVDVYARMDRAGSIEPVTIMWKDGRAFPIDEVLEAGSYGATVRGRQTARYRIRFGDHETDLYLERREPVPALGEPERLLWWVYARDRAGPGHAPAR